MTIDTLYTIYSHFHDGKIRWSAKTLQHCECSLHRQLDITQLYIEWPCNECIKDCNLPYISPLFIWAHDVFWIANSVDTRLIYTHTHALLNTTGSAYFSLWCHYFRKGGVPLAPSRPPLRPHWSGPRCGRCARSALGCHSWRGACSSWLGGERRESSLTGWAGSLSRCTVALFVGKRVADSKNIAPGGYSFFWCGFDLIWQACDESRQKPQMGPSLLLPHKQSMLLRLRM